MANTFNMYFTSIGQNLARQLPSATPFIPPDNPLISLLLKFQLLPLSLLKNSFLECIKKTVGLDRLPGRLQRAAGPVIAHHLAYIFNIYLQSGKFINKSKYAKVLPLFKSCPPMERNNYRPIYILPILSKVLERFVYTSFTVFLEEFNLLRVTQSGFR